MQNQQPPRRRRPMTPEERAMAAERRRQKEILRRRAMRRYYAFLALLGALALAALVGLFFLIKAAAGWARGGQASSVSAAQSVIPKSFFRRTGGTPFISNRSCGARCAPS